MLQAVKAFSMTYCVGSWFRGERLFGDCFAMQKTAQKPVSSNAQI